MLSAFKRQWHKRFDVTIADSGEHGLNKIQEEGPFAVIVSDMRMPEMNGIEFLKEAERIAPDSVRLMLTGNADQQTAIEAVNEGHVYRFLNKPCPNDVMLSTLEASIMQHHMITAEKELIEGTLASSVNLFMDILSLYAPATISMKGTLLDTAKTVAKELDVKDLWQIEMASLMTNIADVTLTPETREKIRLKQDLTDIEKDMVNRLPGETHNLLVNIPRMKRVARIVLYQFKNFDGSGFPEDEIKATDIPIESRILRILHDMSMMQKEQNIESVKALNLMQDMEGQYDPDILERITTHMILEAKMARLSPPTDIKVEELCPGQLLESNIETLDGRILIKAGHTLNDMFVKRLLNYHRISRIKEPVTVRNPV